MHSHSHEHGHTHTHSHEDAQTANGPSALQLLLYMQSHNEEHAHELAHLADRFEAEGKSEAATLLREAVSLIAKGNAKAAEAAEAAS